MSVTDDGYVLSNFIPCWEMTFLIHFQKLFVVWSTAYVHIAKIFQECHWQQFGCLPSPFPTFQGCWMCLFFLQSAKKRVLGETTRSQFTSINCIEKGYKMEANCLCKCVDFVAAVGFVFLCAFSFLALQDIIEQDVFTPFWSQPSFWGCYFSCTSLLPPSLVCCWILLIPNACKINILIK